MDPISDKDSFHTPDPEVNPIEKYIQSTVDSLDLVFWCGGTLKPFIFKKNKYQWILLPVQLHVAYYRIVLMSYLAALTRPITAYSVIFSPGTKTYENYPLSPLGYGFHMTPAIAVSNTFFVFKNVCRFGTQSDAIHTLGVTTRDWVATVEQVRFEVALFKEKMECKYVLSSEK